MSVGFNASAFLAYQLRPLIEDPGLRKLFVFSQIDRTVSGDGTISKEETTGQAYGIAESNPTMDAMTLKMVFPDGEIDKEVIKIFNIDSDVSFDIKRGQTVKVYTRSGGTLLGKYRIMYSTRNMVITDFIVSYGVASK